MKASEIDTSNSFRITSLESLQSEKDFFLTNLPVAGYSCLYFEQIKKGKIKAWFSVAITSDKNAISLPNAPFGGFWCERGLSSESLSSFIDAITTGLRSRGIKNLEITQSPKNYEPQSELVNYLLAKSGWTLKNVLSHQLFSGQKKIKKFIANQGLSIRKKMKLAGLKTSHQPIANFDFLKKIKAWNSQKGYESSLNEDNLIQQVSSYPERYFLIKLEKGDQALGYCLGVSLTSNSIYYYLSGLDSGKDAKGGGDFLLYEFFLLAKELKVDFIDLGSSDLADRANHSLMFFKARFSNEISNKMTWSKEL